jgi:hypothetical protein
MLWIYSFGLPVLGQCRILQEKTFSPQNKKVKLVARQNNSNKVVFFRTSLRVNTDGAPNSYHRFDLTGSQKAINNICNGVAVYKIERNGRRVKLQCAAARQIFARFRDDNWRVPRVTGLTGKT